MSSVAYRRTCADRSGGLKSIRLARATDIEGVVLDRTRRSLLSVTLREGSEFHDCEFVEGSASLLETAAWEAGALLIRYELCFTADPLDHHSASLLEALAAASRTGGLVALVETGGGERLIVGYSARFALEHPLRLATSRGSSGGKREQDAARAITLQCYDCLPLLNLTCDL